MKYLWSTSEALEKVVLLVGKVQKSRAVWKVAYCSVRRTMTVVGRSGCGDFVIQDSHRTGSDRNDVTGLAVEVKTGKAIADGKSTCAVRFSLSAGRFKSWWSFRAWSAPEREKMYGQPSKRLPVVGFGRLIR